MTEIEMIACVGTFVASFGVGYVNAALGDPLGLAKLGLLPRV
jgi:hypothetical protein